MIKLSIKWDYAMKTIIYLLNNKWWLVKISDISLNENISESLLRRVVADLEKASIISTIKWRNWWIELSHNLSNISVYDVLLAVWEELWISNCTKGIVCNNQINCQTTDLYSMIQKWFNSILKIYTLDKIIKKEI